MNDWEAGRSYEFSGSDLDECNAFDLGDPANINLEFFMEIYHTGAEYAHLMSHILCFYLKYNK